MLRNILHKWSVEEEERAQNDKNVINNGFWHRWQVMSIMTSKCQSVENFKNKRHQSLNWGIFEVSKGSWEQSVNHVLTCANSGHENCISYKYLCHATCMRAHFAQTKCRSLQKLSLYIVLSLTQNKKHLFLLMKYKIFHINNDIECHNFGK
jgi:hypothetical protein